MSYFNGQLSINILKKFQICRQHRSLEQIFHGLQKMLGLQAGYQSVAMDMGEHHDILHPGVREIRLRHCVDGNPSSAANTIDIGCTDFVLSTHTDPQRLEYRIVIDKGAVIP